MSATTDRAYDLTDRDTAIAEIRKALKERSGKVWSVTGGRGTGWGWVRIESPPRRRVAHDTNEAYDATTVWGGDRQGLDGNGNKQYVERTDGDHRYYMSDADRVELATLLGLDYVHCQGEQVMASGDARLEYVARARGETPTVFGVQYWD